MFKLDREYTVLSNVKPKDIINILLKILGNFLWG
jgi:hypothetical protein